MFGARLVEPETGIGFIASIVDAANGGPEKRARAAASLRAAQAAALEREALEREMSWMQQGQMLIAQKQSQKRAGEDQLAIEAARQEGQMKTALTLAAVGLVGFALYRRSRV